jgi:hypothetical protein
MPLARHHGTATRARDVVDVVHPIEPADVEGVRADSLPPHPPWSASRADRVSFDTGFDGIPGIERLA